MMVTWLKIWAAQAASRTERKQRFALIEAAYPLQLSASFQSADRRVVRGRALTWQGRPHHPPILEGAGHE